MAAEFGFTDLYDERMIDIFSFAYWLTKYTDEERSAEEMIIALGIADEACYPSRVYERILEIYPNKEGRPLASHLFILRYRRGLHTNEQTRQNIGVRS